LSLISFGPQPLALEIYSKALVYFNGQLFAQNVSVKMRRNAGLKPVATLFKNFAGVEQGVSSLEITIEEAVPVDGFELWSETSEFQGGGDPGMNSVPEYVTITIVAAGNTLTTVGVIDSDELAYAVNAHTALTIHFIGEWSDWNAA
jgi:hypothetical protein